MIYKKNVSEYTVYLAKYEKKTPNNYYIKKLCYRLDWIKCVFLIVVFVIISYDDSLSKKIFLPIKQYPSTNIMNLTNKNKAKA